MIEATQTYLQIDALETNITSPDFNEVVENQLKNLKDTADRQSRDLTQLRQKTAILRLRPKFSITTSSEKVSFF